MALHQEAVLEGRSRAKSPLGKSVIAVSGLEYRWRDDGPPVLALDAVDVRRGERVFVEGPSGSGKSTLLSLLAGVVTPQRGQITVLGQRIDQLSSVQRDHFRSDHVGFIFQLFNLIPYLPVQENVTLPCRFSTLRRKRALARSPTLETEAVRLLSHLDMADQVILNRSVTELSVGQQQRVAAARALMGSPEVLIADEPTSSLDADRRTAFVNLLFQECADSNTTLVFVSHDRSLETLFDRTVHLNEVNAAKHSTINTAVA